MELTEKERNLIYIEIDKNIEKLKKIETSYVINLN